MAYAHTQDLRENIWFQKGFLKDEGYAVGGLELNPAKMGLR